MNGILLLLLGLTSSVLASDVERRTRRDLSVDWLWNTGDAGRRGNDKGQKDLQKSQSDEAERMLNRTRKSRCTVDGVWYNHLGSEMIINTTSGSGILHGEFRTAVERKYGSAGKGPSTLIGHIATNGNQPTFGMTVVWSNGQSVTSWTGQCLLCDGKETLRTTWVMTSQMDSCDEFWMANRIGQDMFRRVEVKDGPRRDENTHNPRDFAHHLEQEELDDQLDL